MLPSPRLEPALGSTLEQLIGKADLGTWQTFQGFREEAEFLDESRVAALDDEPGVPDLEDRVGGGSGVWWRTFVVTVLFRDESPVL